MSKSTKILLAVLCVVGLSVALGVFIHRYGQMLKTPQPDGERTRELPDTSSADGVRDRLRRLMEARTQLSEDFEEGVRLLRNLMADFPESGEAGQAHIILAEEFAKRDRLQDALKELATVIDDPKQGRRASQALLLRAEFLKDSDEPAARKDFEQVRADQQHPDLQMKANLALGRLEITHGEFLKAIDYLRIVAAAGVVDQADATRALQEAVLGQAKKLAKASDWRGVIDWSESQIKEFPDLPLLHNKLRYEEAAAYLELKEFVKARVFAERLLRDVPEEVRPDLDAAGLRDAVTKAEEAAGLLRTRDAFLRAKQAGTETRQHFEGDIDSDRTLSKEESPLVLTGPVTVRNGVTLTVEPGVVMQMLIGAKVTVEGKLVARGTAEQPIRLTSAVTQAPTFFDGEGIEFAPGCAADECVLEHCIIEYQRVGTLCREVAPRLSRCTFRRNGQHGLSVVECAEFPLEGCTFTDNDGTGVHTRRSEIVIRHCRVADNGRDGISLSDKSSPLVEANRISGNRGNGISCDPNVSATIRANEIARSNGDGIYANSVSMLKIEGNVIQGNEGAGINCERHSASEITGNALIGNRGNAVRVNRCGGTIRNNLILNTGSSAINCVEYASPVIEGNWVQGTHGACIACAEACSPAVTRNVFVRFDPYAISTLGKMDISAQNNYFGTMRRGSEGIVPIPDDEIEAKALFDKADSPTLGKVNWSPRLEALPPKPPMPELPELP